MNHQITFGIAANASASEVQAMIDDIAAKFGLSKTVAAEQAAPAGVTVAAPAAVTVAAPAGVTVDKNGLPWDERIHASTKTQNADGSWKKKKGADEAMVAQVTAELRQLMAIPAAASAAPVAAALPNLPAAALPNLPAAGLPSLPVQESPYATFCKFVGGHIHSVENPTGRLTSAWVDELIAAFGVPGGIANLAARPDLIPSIQQHISSVLAQ